MAAGRHCTDRPTFFHSSGVKLNFGEPVQMSHRSILIRGFVDRSIAVVIKSKCGQQRREEENLLTHQLRISIIIQPILIILQ